MSRLLRNELSRAVDELPDDFRVPVVLADIYGFSYREIAEIQDCPIGTVMSRLHRARKGLQTRLIDQAVASGFVKAGASRSKPHHTGLTDLAEYRKRRRVS